MYSEKFARRNVKIWVDVIVHRLSCEHVGAKYDVSAGRVRQIVNRLNYRMLNDDVFIPEMRCLVSGVWQ